MKGHKEIPIIEEIDLYRLISSQECVKYYNMDLKQIESVMKAYSEIVLSAIHMGIRIPLPELGSFYLRTSTYSGGTSNMKRFNGLEILPSITRKFDFEPRAKIDKEISERYKRSFKSKDCKEYKDKLLEYNKLPTLQEISDKYIGIDNG